MKLFGVLNVSVELIVLLAAMTAFATTLAVWHGLIVRDRLGPIMRRLSSSRAEAKAAYLGPDDITDIPAMGFMRRVVDRLKLLKGQQGGQAALKLSRAGMRSQDSATVYMFARVIAPAVAGAVAVLFIYGLGVPKLPPSLKLLVALMVVLVGAMLPDLYIKNRAQKRRHAITKALPDSLDLMVICAEAGLGLDATLARVSREIGPATPEMADELLFTSIELTFQPDRSKALENLCERTDLPSIRAVVNTLRQTERYGTPLAQSMRVLSAEFRNNRMMKAEEKAARLPAIMTVPMIVFILPALFVVIIGPAIMTTIDSLARF